MAHDRVNPADISTGSEAALLALLDGSPLAVVGLDLDRRVVAWNAAAERLFGWTASEVLGETSPLLSGPDVRATEPLRRRLLSGESVEPFEAELSCKDGSVTRVRVSPGPVLDQDGNAVGYVVLAEGVEELRRLEAEARSAHERVEAVLGRVGDGIVAFDRELRYTYVNAKAGEMSGRAPEELVGRLYLDAYPEAEGSSFHMAYTRALAEQRPIFFEDRYAPWDRWFENRIYPSPDGIAVFFTDVTERKRAEAALVESERRFRTLVEATPDLISLLDLEGTFLYASPGWERSLGFRQDEIVGRSLADVLHPDDLALAETLLARMIERGSHETLEVRLRSKGGGWVVVDGTGALITDEDGAPVAVVGISHDVTHRKQAEDELRRSTERLANLREIDQALLAARSLDEIAAAAVVGMHGLVSARRISVAAYDEERDEFVLLAASVEGELEPARRVAVPLSAIDAGALRDGADDVTGNLEDLSAHPAVRALVAQGYRSYVAVALRQAGELAGALVLADPGAGGCSPSELDVAHEVAEQLSVAISHAKAEQALRRLTEELEQRVRERTAEAEAARAAAERADAAKSEFLSRMSHELRTPLNAVLGFSQLMQLRGIEGEHAESVGHIVKAGRHLLALINEVLDLSQIEAGELPLVLEPVELRSMLAEALDLVRPLADSAGVTFPARAPRTASHVLADRRRLVQVVLNLLSNAVKYNRPGGSVTVSCRRRGARVRIAVSDTGRGIPEARLERLFEPFERLGQTAGEGTGLGLAVAHGLVGAMGGALGVRSEAGVGSTFTVDLTVADVKHH